jgi:hypothetical protein
VFLFATFLNLQILTNLVVKGGGGRNCLVNSNKQLLQLIFKTNSLCTIHTTLFNLKSVMCRPFLLTITAVVHVHYFDVTVRITALTEEMVKAEAAGASRITEASGAA